jgi:hypothetical protein
LGESKGVFVAFFVAFFVASDATFSLRSPMRSGIF